MLHRHRPRRGRPRLRVHAIRQAVGPAVAVAVTVAVAATATLGAVRALYPLEPSLIGARRSPAATVPGSAPPLGTPAPATPVAAPTTHTRTAAALVPVTLPPAERGAGSPPEEVSRLLAVSPAGDVAASVERFAHPGPLHVTRLRSHTDQTYQIDAREAPAPIAAAFAPDGTWLAVVSGEGRLWRIDLATGEASLLASASDGLVFGIALDFAADGRLLLTEVGSVRVPMPSRVVALDPSTGALEVLSAQSSAYRPTALADGSVAFFTTRADGTTEARRLQPGSETLVAALGETAWVDASRDGRLIAVERADRTISVIDATDGRTATIGRGSRPKFAPDGDRLSVLDLDGRLARVVDSSGRELSRVPSLFVAWVQCTEGCDR